MKKYKIILDDAIFNHEYMAESIDEVREIIESNMPREYIDDIIDNTYGAIDIGGHEFYPSQILETCDSLLYNLEFYEPTLNGLIDDLIYLLDDGSDEYSCGPFIIEIIEDTEEE